MIDSSEPEIPLLGGDVTEGIVRVGDTVRRPMGRNSAFVHALLQHLEAVGFDGAPRYLGVDAAGREVLSFISGDVAGRPHPAWIADEGRLASIGRLLRRYDDATAGFTAPAEAAFEPPAYPADFPPAPELNEEVVGHLDVTPENVVFRDGAAHALIDFDLARPAARVDELYNAMLWWAPLNEPRDVDPGLRDLDAPRRCRILADAYGMSEPDRLRLVGVAVARTRRSWHVMKHHAEVDGGGWRRMWDEGVGDVIARRATWLERHGPALEAALTAP